MAADFRKEVQALQREDPSNKICFDCSSPNPQWASVTYGNYFCLECSGQHRSLGVHISFVRSISMDSWREDQFKRMKFGGNAKAHDFFHQYGIDHLPLKQKYQTKAAEIYKEKLVAECEGRHYVPPAFEPSMAIPTSAPAAKPITSGGISSSSSGGSAFMTAGNGGVPQTAAALSDKQRNEAYFAQMGSLNASRPADVPPNQGGKYAGFGNSDYTPSGSSGRGAAAEDPWNSTFSSISKGLSFFASKTVEVAKVAAAQAQVVGQGINETVIKPTSQKLADPNLRQNISSTFSSLSKSVVETGDRSIQFLSDTIAGQQGYSRGDGNYGEFNDVLHEDHGSDMNSPSAASPMIAYGNTAADPAVGGNFAVGSNGFGGAGGYGGIGSQHGSGVLGPPPMAPVPIAPLASNTSAASKPAAASDGWNDDEWASF